MESGSSTSVVGDLAAAYQGGMSLVAVGAEFGFDVARVRSLLCAAGVAIRPPLPVREIPPERDLAMIAAYASGLSVREVGMLMSPRVAHSTVHRRLQQLGVRLRPFDPTRPRKKRPIPPSVLGMVVKGWVSGVPLTVITRETGVGPDRIKRHMDELGLMDKRPPRSYGRRRGRPGGQAERDGVRDPRK